MKKTAQTNELLSSEMTTFTPTGFYVTFPGRMMSHLLACVYYPGGFLLTAQRV